MGKKNIFDKSDAIFLGINILLAIVVVVIILVSLIAYLKSYTQHGVEVEVSNVRGLAKEDAEAVLDQQGLRLVVIDSTYSEKVPFGTIVEQSCII